MVLTPVTEFGTIKDLTPDEIVEDLIASSDSGDDIWEAAISAALLWTDQIDKHKYVLGDLARLIEKKYGEDRIGSFAKSIKAPVARIKEYRTLTSRFPKNLRALIFEENPNITYTHLRDVSKIIAKYPDDYGYKHAMRVIEMISKYDWTCEKAGIKVTRLLGKKPSPKKLIDCEAFLAGADEKLTQFELPKEDASMLARLWLSGKVHMRVVIYASEITSSNEVKHG